MDAAPVATLAATIVTHTVDHLAYSPSPPMIQAVLDVDGGGRCTIEVTDAEPERLRVGARVAFTFRRLFTSGGVHDYFWKSHLLDSRIGGRWQAAESLTRWRLSAWAAPGSASAGTAPPKI